MDYLKAKSIFKPHQFPFGERYKNEKFIIVAFPLKELYPRVGQTKIVEKYEKASNIDPIWVSVGRKMRSGKIQPYWDNRSHIEDGNHRTEAMKRLGKKSIKTIIPESHWEVYKSWATNRVTQKT